ncbi:MAG: hypothetical protein E7265_02565 [Lachnospiraceae bacterium]|nr:hypothetical protein [Lachnospiraceae bacterium]
MKSIVKYFCIIFTIMLGINILEAQSVSAKTLVEKRLEAVQKEYPDESYFKEYVTVDGFSGGGCNALVMYTTLKVFHNAYVPYCDTYTQIGKTTSTKKISAMKKLFKKAKPGDVIRWRQGYSDAHFAIFLSANDDGICVYENNWGAKKCVKNNHFWKWENMKTWPSGGPEKGADKVNIYRSKNYKKVNQKKSATNYKKGDNIVVDGICYEVISVTPIGGTVKFVSYEIGSENKKIPKFLYINKDAGDLFNTNEGNDSGSSKKKGINTQILYQIKQ